MDNTLPQKALSIQQPWAFLIINGFKTVENRTWRTKYRGKVLVHAGLKFDHIAYETILLKHPEVIMPGNPGRWRRSDWQLGGIVGEVEIIDCVTQHSSPFFFGPFGFVLANACPLPFIPCRGMLGLFTPTIPRAEYIIA